MELLIVQFPPVPEVKSAVREVHHPPPSNTKITNEWSYTAIPTIRLHVVNKHNFRSFTNS
jgi:hypothetical protein